METKEARVDPRPKVYSNNQFRLDAATKQLLQKSLELGQLFPVNIQLMVVFIAGGVLLTMTSKH